MSDPSKPHNPLQVSRFSGVPAIDRNPELAHMSLKMRTDAADLRAKADEYDAKRAGHFHGDAPALRERFGTLGIPQTRRSAAMHRMADELDVSARNEKHVAHRVHLDNMLDEKIKRYEETAPPRDPHRVRTPTSILGVRG